jgi:oxygen-independent coproporphyrinogen-3 oxidase
MCDLRPAPGQPLAPSDSAAASAESSLAERLSRPGPRYTSYPTAAHFHDGFGTDAHRVALALSNDPLPGGEARPVSLYVHVPFCEALCHYCGCHALAGAREARVQKYLGYLEREADLLAGLVSDERPVVQLHFGGGTPTTLGADGLERFVAHLRARFRFAADAECSIEADPRTLTLEVLRAMRRAGFSRLSLGVQSFDPDVQRAIGREQPFHAVEEAVLSARACGFVGVSFDLIYGLPCQTEASWAATLQQVLALSPDRASVFGYAHVPWMKRNQQRIDAAALPGAETRYRMLTAAGETLGAAGYVPVGLDHFARPEDPLAVAARTGTLHRNFQGYSTRAGCDVLGLGVSSISGFERAYAQNEKGLRRYYDALDDGRLPTTRGVALTREDRLRRAVISEIMCHLSLDVRRLEARSDIGFDEHFADALRRLQPLRAEGLVEVTADRIAVPPDARPFLRHVAMAFDAYAAPEADSSAAPASRPRYSQTV